MPGEFATTAHYQARVASPIPGCPDLGLLIDDDRIVAIDYLWGESAPRCAQAVKAHCLLLQRYFSGNVKRGDSWLKPAGTPFQQRVWRRLLDIPWGHVMTYGELARELNSSPRAVAGACRANPIPILIPCHRVISATGIGGYMGKTAGPELAIKSWLLQHEGHV